MMVAAADTLAAASGEINESMERREAKRLLENARFRKFRHDKLLRAIAAGWVPLRKRRRLSITMEDGLAAAAGQLDVSGWVKVKQEATSAAVVPAKKKRRQVSTTAEACVAVVADGIVATAGWLKTEQVIDGIADNFQRP